MGTSDVCHIIGVDLGQAADPSALAVIERQWFPAGHEYVVRHLKRWPLGTSYVAIADEVVELASRAQLVDPTLVVDGTGVGRAVVDLLRYRADCAFRPVSITSGARASRQPDGWYHVPKKDLVGVLQALLGSRRLHVVATLSDAAVLVREPKTFRAKITAAGNETYAADWRDNGSHDDLVLATAIGAWVGENCTPGPLDPAAPPGARSLMSRAPDGVFSEEGGAEW